MHKYPISLAVATLLAASCASLHAQTMHAEPEAMTTPTVPTAVREPGVPEPAPVHPDLSGVFTDFGGMPGMTALMEDFMQVMLEDPRLKPFFEHADQPRIKRQLAEQFCAILNGGCAYSGRDMKATHAAFAIDRADFNALVEDLQIAMERRKIPFSSQNKLLAVLAPMHREVINR
jgi:hemoglobin